MEEFNYDKQLAAAKEAASKLKTKLEERILGEHLSAWQCGCGTISAPETVAIAVVPGGSNKKYEGQIGTWYQWTVSMRAVGQTKSYTYPIGLSTFLPTEEIKSMFGKAFKGIDLKKLEIEGYRRNPN